MTGPVVTVVIPTRNRPNLLLRAVKSALAQTHSKLEVLVVIDGRCDTTSRALEAIADVRLRIISLPRPVGGSEARNTGVHHARGEWVAFLDDDDAWLRRKLEMQLNLASRAPAEWTLLSCRIIARTPRADYHWPRRYPENNEPLSEYLFVRKSLFRGEGSVQTSTFFARKALFQRCPFRSGLLKHQDLEWLLRAAQLPGFRVLFVDEPVVVHFIEEKRQTVSNKANWQYSLKWVRENRGFFTPKAYAAFVVNHIAPEAADEMAISAIPSLLREGSRDGQLGAREFLRFAGMWILPRNARRHVRDLLTKLQLSGLRTRVPNAANVDLYAVD